MVNGPITNLILQVNFLTNSEKRLATMQQNFCLLELLLGCVSLSGAQLSMFLYQVHDYPYFFLPYLYSQHSFFLYVKYAIKVTQVQFGTPCTTQDKSVYLPLQIYLWNS